MSQVLIQQENAASELMKARGILNWTMREALAEAMDPRLLSQTEYFDGVFVISRCVDPNEVEADKITKFQKSTVNVAEYRDLKGGYVANCIESGGKELVKLIHKIGLLDSDVLDSTGPVPHTGQISVQYPLKNPYHQEKYSNARFCVSGCKKLDIGKSTTIKYSVLYGVDPDNHAYFFRVSPVKQADEEQAEAIKEGVIVFNRSARLDISSIAPPSVEQRKDPVVISAAQDNAYKAIPEKLIFNPDKHDPTLYFLRSKFPASRYIRPTGSSNGFPDDADVVLMKAHKRMCTWQIARLHWVYEGLCSVIASMVLGKAGTGQATAEPESSVAPPPERKPHFVEPLMNPPANPDMPTVGESPGGRMGSGNVPREYDDDESKGAEEHEDGDESKAAKKGPLVDTDPSSSEMSKFTTSTSGMGITRVGLRVGYSRDPETMENFVSHLVSTTESGNKATDLSWKQCCNFIHNYITSGKASTKDPDTRLGSYNHDDMLKQIARMAKLATDVYKAKSQGHLESGSALKNLSSVYNNVLGIGIDCNEIKYFGYKMTQWLLSELEVKDTTLLIPKKDQGVAQSKHLRVQLRDVNCQLYTTGHRSTYTTDVLIDMRRRAWIHPWLLMFGEDKAKWPGWLTGYSLETHFSNAPSKKIAMSDKQVSVTLDITHKFRLTFNSFKHRVEGSNPVATNKKLVRAMEKIDLAVLSKQKQFKGISKKNYHQKRLNAALRTITGEKRQMMLSREAEDVPGGTRQTFAFGAAPGPWRWQQ